MDEQAAAELAAWAEHQMKLNANSVTALRGAAAAEFGRATIDRALGEQHLTAPAAAAPSPAS